MSVFNNYRVEIIVLTAVYSAILINIFQFQTLEGLVREPWPWFETLVPFNNLGLPALGAFSALMFLFSTVGGSTSLRGVLPKDPTLNVAIALSLVWVCAADWIHEGLKSSLADFGIFIYATSVFIAFRVLIKLEDGLGRIQASLMLAFLPIGVFGAIELYDVHFWQWYPGHSNKGTHSVSGFLQRKELFAYVMGLSFLLSCSELFNPGGRKVLAGISLFFCSLGIYFSGSRSVLLALVVMLFVIFLRAIYSHKDWNEKFALFQRLLIILVVTSSVLFSVTSFVHIPGDLSSYLLSNDGARFAMWAHLFHQVYEAPVAENLFYGMGKIAFAERVAIPATGFLMISSHNLLLQLFIQYGLVGSSLLFYCGFRFFQHAYRQGSNVVLVWGYYIVVGLTSYLNAYPLVYMTVALLCAVGVCKTNRSSLRSVDN